MGDSPPLQAISTKPQHQIRCVGAIHVHLEFCGWNPTFRKIPVDPPENPWTPKTPGLLIPVNILALEVAPWTPETPQPLGMTTRPMDPQDPWTPWAWQWDLLVSGPPRPLDPWSL